MRCSSRVSACRRELNSLDATKSRGYGVPQERGRAENRTTLPKQPSSGMANKATNRNDMEPQCYIEPPHCVGGPGFQSVRRAAASIGVSHFAQRWRLEYVACRGRQRGAGGTCSRPRGITLPFQACRQRTVNTAQPNPSFKPSPNSVARRPSSAGPAAHFALAVQRATLSVPA